MATTSAETQVMEKTIELCQAILQDDEFRGIRKHVDAFMSNDKAQTQYQNVVEKAEMLNHKQQQGVTLTAHEIADFEQEKENLNNNDIARSFMEAQREMHKMQEKVNQYISKTFELGRVPEESDFEGGCGHGCGCHH